MSTVCVSCTPVVLLLQQGSLLPVYQWWETLLQQGSPAPLFPPNISFLSSSPSSLSLFLSSLPLPLLLSSSPSLSLLPFTPSHCASQLLQDRCLRTEQCVAFTGRGEFKNHLRSRETWTNSSDGKGIYVAGEASWYCFELVVWLLLPPLPSPPSLPPSPPSPPPHRHRRMCL